MILEKTMKKFLILILSLVCIFAIALFAACESSTGDNNGDTNVEQPDDNDDNKDKTPDGGDQEDDGKDKPHTHTFETTWSYDSQNHWLKASCHPEEIKDKAPHNYQNGKCGVCGRFERYEVGDKLPDFTVETYNSSYTAGKFSSVDARGKILVINFWYVSCGVCIDEMPDLEELNDTYGDDIVVIALHKDNNEQSGAQAYIDLTDPNDTNHHKTSWSNYKTIFGKDVSGDKLYNWCAQNNGAYPVTIVLDQEGTIIQIQNGSIMHFDMSTFEYTNVLISTIEEALANYEKPETPDNPGDKEDPENPENPENPGDKEDPETPDNPDNPGDKEDPENPENPDNPGDKEDPENPENPDNPGDKEDPEDPENPDNPGDKEDPEDPENPDNPGDKEDPEDPDNPDNPGDKEDPEDPENPDNPSDKEDPEDPENPDNPGDKEDPEPEPPHVCTYQWLSDKNNHWRITTCAEHPQQMDMYGPHTYANGKCSTCGTEQQKTAYTVGDKLPDFTVETYNSSYTNGTFSSADARGKILVINFWYVSCGVCIDEMPDLEELNKMYGDDIVVLALHKDNDEQSYAQAFIDSKRWSSYTTIFGKDLSGDQLYNMCAKDFGAYPVTVVLDQDGIIINITYGSIMEFNMEPPYGYTNVIIPYIEAALKDKKAY